MQHGAIRTSDRPGAASKGCRSAGVRTGLGCLGMLILAGAIAWGVWTATDWYGAFIDETHIWWIVGASLALVLGLGALKGGFSGKSDSKLIKAAREKAAPVDGKRNAFIGTVHAGGEPLLTPITKTEAVLYEYTIARRASDISGKGAAHGNEAAHYTGTHMRGPVVQTSHGSVRVFSLPRLVGFPEEQTFDPGEIESFVDATTFERKSVASLASVAFEDMFDEDGIIGWDAQLRERPSNFSGFGLKTELVREGAEVCVIGKWNRQEGTVGAGEMIEMLNAQSEGALARAGGGGAGCGCFTGIILLIISVSILALPLVPAEWLLKVPVVSELVLDKRAENVERHLEAADYDRARRLSGLGLAGRSIERLPRLLEEEPDLVEVLIANGADPGSVGPAGETLLMMAEDIPTVERMLRHGVPRQRVNRWGGDAADIASQHGRIGVLSRLVDPEGEGAPLAIAIRNNRNDELEALLESGMSPEARIELRDRTVSPLFYASVYGNEEAVAQLLEAGASPEGGDYPPLYGAVESDSPAIARLLTAAGADPRYDEDPETDAMFRAVVSGKLEMVETLVELGGGGSPMYAGLGEGEDAEAIEQALERARQRDLPAGRP